MAGCPLPRVLAPFPGEWCWESGVGAGCARRCGASVLLGLRSCGSGEAPAHPLAVSADPVAVLPARAHRVGVAGPASAAQPALAVACSPSPPSLVGYFVSKFKVENYAPRMGLVCLSSR